MLITDKEQLKQYDADHRIWQGIPGIEVTPKGRIFSAFYSGDVTEAIGNYVVLLKSDDGVNFGEPIAAVYKENARCFDECIWIDPLGRLWLFWAVYPDFDSKTGDNYGTYAVYCEDPDADALIWSEEIFVGYDIMLNKPTVLSTGEWLLPISVWGERVWTWMPERRTTQKELGAFVYRTSNQGKTFEKLGGMVHPDHAYDEHMIVEKEDGTLVMYTRIMQGVGLSYSYDRGKTWTEGVDAGLGGPNSRFFVRKLKSGRWLLVNHYEYTGRDHLTAMLSEDEGKTWPYKLLLDERDNVSYPDAVEVEDGFLYITYDRERGCGRKSLEEMYSDAREVLYAKICEEDIIAGEVVNPESKMRQVISALGEYKGTDTPFTHPIRQNELVDYFIQFPTEELPQRILPWDRGWARVIDGEVGKRLDAYFDIIDIADDKYETLHQLLTLIDYETRHEEYSVTESVRNVLLANLDTDMTAFTVADKLGVSRYWLKYRFENATKISVEEYQKTLRSLVK
ncbi:MAG: exo-alpha-sialidase [Clostridia bacterium]|nr:exo-alpha-sialidase [Clostridia bacterium]